MRTIKSRQNENQLFLDTFYLCQNKRANKISASSVSPKWVKNNGHRRERERRRGAKVSFNNGQYKCMDQNIFQKDKQFPIFIE